MRARTRARGAAGWMKAKSRMNSPSVWLMRTRLQYAPWAVASSRSIWICCGSPGGLGVSDMSQLYHRPGARSVVVHSPLMSRVVGIDLGRRQIGVALSDGLGLTAQPHT